ncbi:hypothetical protein DL93DRAFT_2066548 [Clavulina sp. PMI_390]|nr:hypothetical protein DL93DRAFT_2066548 [Clavulina sp. PMI_390]
MSKSTLAADVILKSEDGVLFKIHQLILSEASEFFRTMYSLPPGPKSSDPTPLSIDANSKVVAWALAIIYGKPYPPKLFDNTEKIDKLIAFCEKWSMHGVLMTVRCALQRPSLIHNHHTWLYRVACRQGWAEVADAVAMECLNYDLGSSDALEVFEPISLTDFRPLLALARRRVNAFRDKLDDDSVFPASSPPFKCPRCDKDCEDRTWLVLRARLLEELQSCPGREGVKKISIDMDGWPEWEACVSARHCDYDYDYGYDPYRLFDPSETKEKIIAALDDLPESLSG